MGVCVSTCSCMLSAPLHHEFWKCCRLHETGNVLQCRVHSARFPTQPNTHSVHDCQLASVCVSGARSHCLIPASPLHPCSQHMHPISSSAMQSVLRMSLLLLNASLLSFVVLSCLDSSVSAVDLLNQSSECSLNTFRRTIITSSSSSSSITIIDCIPSVRLLVDHPGIRE